MKYQVGEYEAIHQSPIWKDRANFIFAAHIGVKDGKNEWEQLWGEQVAPNRFILCCIPFFSHNMALGDEIETNADFVFQRVIWQSGQFTFRVWFGSQDIVTRERIVQELKLMGLLMEWSSENLLAISAINDIEAQKIADYLKDKEEKSLLQYETGL